MASGLDIAQIIKTFVNESGQVSSVLNGLYKVMNSVRHGMKNVKDFLSRWPGGGGGSLLSVVFVVFVPNCLDTF